MTDEAIRSIARHIARERIHSVISFGNVETAYTIKNGIDDIVDAILSLQKDKIDRLEETVTWLRSNPLCPPCNAKCQWCKTGKKGTCYCGYEQWAARKPHDL